MAKRRTLASQQRMKIITELAQSKFKGRFTPPPERIRNGTESFYLVFIHA